MEKQIAPLVLEGLEQVQQMRQGSAKAVYRPGGD